jgi:hypothetical protein
VRVSLKEFFMIARAVLSFLVLVAAQSSAFATATKYVQASGSAERIVKCGAGGCLDPYADEDVLFAQSNAQKYVFDAAAERLEQHCKYLDGKLAVFEGQYRVAKGCAFEKSVSCGVEEKKRRGKKSGAAVIICRATFKSCCEVAQ